MILTECPICDGQLQATRVTNHYLDVEELEIEVHDRGTDCEIIESRPAFGGREEDDDVEIRVYCENDHSSDEMADYLTRNDLFVDDQDNPNEDT